MLNRSRLCFPRSAVAFFNMKHFQTKHKCAITPDNVYSVFSSYLKPGDRLLRQSVSGNGGSRVLVLDHLQKVKGVYLPLFCLPHPSSIRGGDGSLGVTVESYLSCITALRPTAGDTAATTDARQQIPTVLAVLAHADGAAFGTFYADGRPAVPLVNLDVTLSSTAHLNDSVGDSKLAQGFRSLPRVIRPSTAVLPTLRQLQKLAALHKDEVEQCSTFYWFTRDQSQALTLSDMRQTVQQSLENEYILDGAPLLGASEEPANAPQVISFSDPRWVELLDFAIDSARGHELYSRDHTTQRRTVHPPGMQKLLMSGFLLLDYRPQCVVEAEKAAAAAKSTQAS